MIALIASIAAETELLRRLLSPCEVRSCGRRELFRGSLCGHSVGLLHGGVGKASAAAAVGILLETVRPSLVISLGVGGAYPGSDLAVGDLALATEEIHGDEGVITPEGFLDMEDIGFPLVQRNGHRFFNAYPVQDHLLDSARPILERHASLAGRRMTAGTFVTVSTCSGTDAAGEEMARRTGGICENMEGAAIAQICALYSVPFLEVRGISNLTGDRDLSRWDIRRGAEAAQLAVHHLLLAWQGGKERA